MVADQVIQEWRSRPFDWGRNDCARFIDDFSRRVFRVPIIMPDEYPVRGAKFFRSMFRGERAAQVYRERLTSAGFCPISPGPRAGHPSVAIVPMGGLPAGLAVWDGSRLWMVGTKGVEEIEPCCASEFWEPPIKKI